MSCMPRWILEPRSVSTRRLPEESSTEEAYIGNPDVDAEVVPHKLPVLVEDAICSFHVNLLHPSSTFGVM